MNTKRQRFVDAYVGEAAGNAAEAARIAGYAPKSARVQGSQLLTDPNVRAAVEARATALATKAEATNERIIQEVTDVALTKVEVTGTEKMKALDMLGRYRKLWHDKSGNDSASRITVNIGFLSTDHTQPTPLPTITVTAKD